MGRSKDAWLQGPGDLKEADVEDVPVRGESVRVRGLPAAYSNQASSEALEWSTGPRGQQTARVNSARLEVLQFAHGVIDPGFSEAEAQTIAQKFGPAFKKVIAQIDELSGVDKEAIEQAEHRFPDGGDSAAGSGDEPATAGGKRPDLHARAGAGVGDDGQ